MNNSIPTVGSALQRARQMGLPPTDAERLLLHVLGPTAKGRAWLRAHDTDPITPAAQAQHQRLCERRADDEPLAYLVGERAFYGLTLQVDARVLDPRPDTETLVDWALDHLPANAPCQVADLGTGSGAIALALLSQRPQAQVLGVDASPEALTVAAANAARLELPLVTALGHWFGGLQPFGAPALPAWVRAGSPWLDVVVSNPPYIAQHDPHLPALRHEPRGALVSGQDGLDDLRQIVHAAPLHLKPGGWLLLEHGFDQATAVAALLRARGFEAVTTRKDLAGLDRCTGGRWAGAHGIG